MTFIRVSLSFSEGNIPLRGHEAQIWPSSLEERSPDAVRASIFLLAFLLGLGLLLLMRVPICTRRRQ